MDSLYLLQIKKAGLAIELRNNMSIVKGVSIFYRYSIKKLLIKELADIRARTFIQNTISLYFQQGNADNIHGTQPIKNLMEEIYYCSIILYVCGC